MNDKRWKYSNVFFRYGAFVSMYVNKDGQNVPAIQRPDGTLIPDVRAPYYEVPDFVEEPVEIQIMTKKLMQNLIKKTHRSLIHTMLFLHCILAMVVEYIKLKKRENVCYERRKTWFRFGSVETRWF